MSNKEEKSNSMPELIVLPDPNEVNNESSNEKMKKHLDTAKKSIAEYIDKTDTVTLITCLLAFILFLCFSVWMLKGSNSTTQTSAKDTNSSNNQNSAITQRYRSI